MNDPVRYEINTEFRHTQGTIRCDHSVQNSTQAHYDLQVREGGVQNSAMTSMKMQYELQTDRSTDSL